MKNSLASRANDAYAVLDEFSAVSVNCSLVSFRHCIELRYKTYLSSSCLEGDRITELCKTLQEFIHTSGRLWRQREAQDRHVVDNVLGM